MTSGERNSSTGGTKITSSARRAMSLSPSAAIARTGARFERPGDDVALRLHAVRQAVVVMLSEGHLRSEGPELVGSAFEDEALRVGDILELGISHPCLTLDRWTHVPLVNADLRVVGAIRTCF